MVRQRLRDGIPRRRDTGESSTIPNTLIGAAESEDPAESKVPEAINAGRPSKQRRVLSKLPDGLVTYCDISLRCATYLADNQLAGEISRESSRNLHKESARPEAGLQACHAICS
jgi:hypothetical protein